ncbi:hypothetical protein BD413DRAFT_470355 [Trametes elegans]|nr:hypothetical protein BD413DRAFT_470355 [Trametes elegans]
MAILATASNTDPDSYLVLERYLLAGDLIIGVGYGLQLVLWFLCVSHLWGQRHRGRKITFLLVYLPILLAIETVCVIAQGNYTQLEFVDNRDFPGGPWQFHLLSQAAPASVVYNAGIFVLSFLTDLLVLWRCWVVWSAFEKRVALLATAFPALVLLGSFIVGIIFTLEAPYPNLPIYNTFPLAFGTAYIATTFAFNVTATALIIVRLAMYRREHKKLLPVDSASQYLSLAAIVVESAAVQAAFSLAFIVVYATNVPENLLLVGCASAAQQIATYLIIYRVADGKAWSRERHLRTLTAVNLASRTGAAEKLEQSIAIPSLPFLTEERSSESDFNARSGCVGDSSDGLSASGPEDRSASGVRGKEVLAV